MTTINLSNPQKQLSVWVKAQKPIDWISYAIAGAMLLVRALTGGLFVVPLYIGVAYGLVTLNKYRRKTPKPVRVVALVGIATTFIFFSLTSFAPAHALFFNTLLDLLTKALTAFGVPGLDKVPNWIVQGFKIITLVSVGAIFVKLLRSRQGDEEETTKGFSQVIKVILILAIGDVVLSLIGV